MPTFLGSTRPYASRVLGKLCHRMFGGHVSPSRCQRLAVLMKVSPDASRGEFLRVPDAGQSPASERLTRSVQRQDALQVTAVCWWEILSHLSSSWKYVEAQSALKIGTSVFSVETR